MSNFPCPECGVTLRHAARSCAGCGWGKSGKRTMPATGFEPINAEQYAERIQREADFSRECREWLDRNHITKQAMTQPERMKAMAGYRSMLRGTFRKADIEPRAWAHSLKTDYLAGAPLLQIQISMASEALHEHWENRQCTPIAEAA